MKRVATSKLDRLGLLICAILVIALGIMLMNRLNTNDPTVASSALTIAAPASAQSEVEPETVPTTAPVQMPTARSEQDASVAIPVSQTADDGKLLESPTDMAEVDTHQESSTLDTAEDTTSEIEVEAIDATPPVAAASPQAAAAVPNPQPATTAVPNPQPAATAVPNPPPATTAVPNPQPATTIAAAVPDDAPAGGTFTHTLTATVSRPSLHTSPGGPVFTPSFNGTALPAVNPTVFGNPLVYRVLAGAPGDAWAKVYVPARPNGTTAWVQTAEFTWGSSNRMLQINVTTRSVTVFEGTNVLLTNSAVLGKSSSPTPLANGWVEEIMAGPSAAYGTKLISLGMFSDALSSFGGGIPKIALHGTNQPGLMGQYASNGCIRVPNDIINQIATILPVGSKVTIVG